VRLLYLTDESYISAPIIESQVVNLLDRVAGFDDISCIALTTFDDIASNEESRRHDSPKLAHILRKNRGHWRNLLAAVRIAIRERTQYDIVHVRSYVPMIPALTAKLLFRKKVVFDPRGLLADELSYEAKRPILSAIVRFFEGLFCRFADHVVVVSTPFRDYFMSRYGVSSTKITVVPTFSSIYSQEGQDGADVALRDELGWNDAFVLVYSGSLEQWQLVDQVIAFFRRASERINEARFLVLTTQTDRFEQMLAEKLPRGKYAVRRVASKALARYLAACDVGILFRRHHIVNRVSAPIKVKDYLIAGLPIIMSAGVGDSSQFVLDHGCGIVLSDLSTASMDGAIEMLVSKRHSWDRDVIRRTAKAAFDVSVAAEHYRRIYRSLVRNDGTPDPTGGATS
jgi:glycosyltransferase involved in cell wall biosynthesis